VRSSQVNHKLLVQIYPYIVISQEIKGLSSFIGKVAMNRQAKSEVVIRASIVAPVAPSTTIDREEKEVGKIEYVLRLSYHANVIRNSYGLGVQRKPILETCRTSNRPMGAHAGIDISGEAIRTKRSAVLEIVGSITYWTHQSRFQTSIALRTRRSGWVMCGLSVSPLR
jgi:hypothetical protein